MVAKDRPFSVTLLATGVLIFAATNLARVVFSIQQRETLAGFLPISPYYLTLSGLVWLVASCILVWGIWFGRHWAVRGTLVSLLGYSIYYWADRLLLAADKPGYNWLFSAAANLLLLGMVYWALNNRKAKLFFGELNDR